LGRYDDDKARGDHFGHDDGWAEKSHDGDDDDDGYGNDDDTPNTGRFGLEIMAPIAAPARQYVAYTAYPGHAASHSSRRSSSAASSFDPDAPPMEPSSWWDLLGWAND
jgi:hypothetical protein